MIKLGERKIFTRLVTPLPWSKIFVTRMLTCDLFAVANLLVVVGLIELNENFVIVHDYPQLEYKCCLL